MLGFYTGPAVVDSTTRISDVVITGGLEIRAPVTMHNVRVVCASVWACLRVLPTGSLDISDFEIVGPGQAGVQNLGGIVGDNIVARRGEITGVENGLVGSANLLAEDIYVHDLALVGSGHPDGVQLDGGNTNITLRRCHIEVKSTDTSAVMIDNYYGASSGIVIEDSHLSGGGYTLYLDGQFNSSPIGVASIVDTTFAGFAYGPVLRRGPVMVANQSGNQLVDGRPMAF